MSIDLDMLAELREIGPLLEGAYRRPVWQGSVPRQANVVVLPRQGRTRSASQGHLRRMPGDRPMRTGWRGEAGIWADENERARRKAQPAA